MTYILIMLALLAGMWVVLWISPIHRLGRRQILDSTDDVGNGNLPPVTIIIPARNEASTLPRTIPTICAQDYPDLRVIVVDDQSDDESSQVLERLAHEHHNLIVVSGEDRPEGWCGKPWAVHQGYKRAETDWLLFTDADIIFHPRAIQTAIRYAQAHELEMLSLFPQMIYGSLAEKVAMAGLVTLLCLMFPLKLVNSPKWKVALAAGGFILTRRAAYEKVGGHEALKSEMIEDVNLGRRMKAVGVRSRFLMTRDLVLTRMYEGWADLWEGLAKNCYAGMDYQPRKFWVGTMFSLVTFILPPVYLIAATIWACITRSREATWAAALAAMVVACMTLIHLRTIRLQRLSWWQALLLPVSAALYTLIAIHSAWQNHYRGGNLWKGRRYGREMLLAGGGSAQSCDQDGSLTPP